MARAKPTAKQLANLKPPVSSGTQARELGRLGGIKSQQVQKAARTFKEMIKIALEREIMLNDGKKATTLEGVVIAQINKAMEGEVSSAVFLRDSIGEKPTDKVAGDKDAPLMINIIDKMLKL